MATATKKAAPRAASKTSTTKTDAIVELTPIDDGVSIKVTDQHATIRISGTFDQDGLIAVAKRVNQARAEVS